MPSLGRREPKVFLSTKSLEQIENRLKGKNLAQYGHLLLVGWNEPLNFGDGDFVDEGNEFGFWTTEKQTNKPKKKDKESSESNFPFIL